MRCRQALETLAHILNVCPQYAPLMRERHNKILERTVKAIPPSAGDHFVEQTVSGSPFDLRPDIVCINASERTATIVDITVTFEWSPGGPTGSQRREREKVWSPSRVAEGRKEPNLSLVGGAGGGGPWVPGSSALRGPSTSAEDLLFSTKSCAPLMPSGR